MSFLPMKRPATMSQQTPMMPPTRLLSYRVANMQGLGNRENQQDSFAFVNALNVREMKRNGLFAILADGMGGMNGGELASELAIESMKGDFQLFNRDTDLSLQLRDSAVRAGEAIYQQLGGNGGTTVVACIFYAERLTYISVGDSCLYLLRNHLLTRINREQNVLNLRYLETIQSGNLDPTSAEADPERSAIVGFLGMPELPEPDRFLKPLPLRDGDMLLLCSDGVAGKMTEEELVSCMSLESPDKVCRALEEQVLKRQETYQDNYTALVVQCRK